MLSNLLKIFLILILFINCNQSLEESTYDIRENWEYKIGFESNWLDPQDTANWKPISLPVNLTKNLELKSYSGYITLRKEIPEPLKIHILENHSLAFNAGRVLDVSRYFLNGKEFGKLGSEKPYIPAAMRPFLREIPANLFDKNKKNYLQIILYTNGSFPLQFMDPPVIGRPDLVYSERNKNEIYAFFFLTTYLISGLYHILLTFKRPVDIHNLYYGIFCLIVSIYWFVANTVSRDELFESNVFLQRKIEHALLFATSPTFVVFMLQFFQRKQNKFSMIYSGACYFMMFLTLVSPLAVMRICSLTWQISNVAIVLPYILYFMFKQIQKKNKDAKYLIFSTVIMCFGVIIDILVSQGIIKFPFVSNFTFFIFVMGIATMMANKFMEVTNDFESLNQNLEKKVEERTNELKNTLDQVQTLKEQQDGDYFLTSLLVKPLSGNFTNFGRDFNVQVEMQIKQKKTFEFKKRFNEIGGDLCVVDIVMLQNEEYTIFANADAMGKSIQGAGGALVFGTAFKAILERTKITYVYSNLYPELWLKETFKELQKVLVTFNGSMLISTIIGLIHNQNGLVYQMNAEHPNMILYRDGEANFLEHEYSVKKLGVDIMQGELRVNIFRMEKGDVLICGSDGKDDILMGNDTSGNRIINEDEKLFLEIVKENSGEILGIERIIKSKGEFTDDLSLIRIFFNGEKTYFPLIHPYEPLEKAKALQEANEIYGAEFAYSNALELSNNHPEILWETAEFYVKQKVFSKAGILLDECIRKEPENHAAYYLASFVKKKLKDINQGILYGECYRTRNPNSIMNLINLADLYRLDGDDMKALKLINRALIIEPNNEKALKLKSSLEV